MARLSFPVHFNSQAQFQWYPRGLKNGFKRLFGGGENSINTCRFHRRSNLDLRQSNLYNHRHRENTGKNIWSYDSTIVVYDDGVETTEEYRVSRLTGSVTFDSVDAGRVITVSGEYTVPTTVATAKYHGIGRVHCSNYGSDSKGLHFQRHR